MRGVVCSISGRNAYRLGARTTTPLTSPFSQLAMNTLPGPVAIDAPPPLWANEAKSTCPSQSRALPDQMQICNLR